MEGKITLDEAKRGEGDTDRSFYGYSFFNQQMPKSALISAQKGSPLNFKY